VIVLTIGMNTPCLERWSITTRIAVKPKEGGSCSIKSIEMEFHGQDGIGAVGGVRKAYGRESSITCRWCRSCSSP
jgi:hypothetical protein